MLIEPPKRHAEPTCSPVSSHPRILNPCSRREDGLSCHSLISIIDVCVCGGGGGGGAPTIGYLSVPVPGDNPYGCMLCGRLYLSGICNNKGVFRPFFLPPVPMDMTPGETAT